MHLAKLVRADLLTVESQGRHRYYKFSRKEIAYAIEAMVNLIPHATALKKISTENTPGIKYCRTCYDHLAGKVAVSITKALLQFNLLVLERNEFIVTRNLR